MKRAFPIIMIIMLVLAGGCSNLLGGEDDDLGDFTADELPASGATKPADNEEAKAIYTEASTVLYEAMDAQAKRLNSREAQSQTIDETIDWSNDKVSMKGTIKGKINMDFPTDMTAGNFTVMDSSINFSLNGTMTDLEVTDPEESSKSYVISGKIEHNMVTENLMTVTIAGTGETMTFSPEGHFKTDVNMKTAYSVKRKSDGKGAKFVLTFSDNQDITITPQAAGAGQGGSNGGMGDPTCGYFEKKAKLTAYDDAGQVIFENVEVPLSDIPWMMGQSFGAGPGGEGGGPGGGGGAVVIPDLTAANPAYATYEADFLTAINTVRTNGSVATFASTDANLDALARRYAEASVCDTDPTHLKTRVGSAIGTCSDAAFFLGGSTTLADFVNKMMNEVSVGWVNQQGGMTAMRNAGFTKIGIGMAVGTNAGTLPGDTWHSVIVLLATP